ncbi:ATP:cob(I)alamin adenosyltransferase [Ancylostoma duodenale]|uniref:Corrinoid adenosyltransferase MMAB n=1 Tax=Ancylostoma duodenale TaxID=51022 RepID=A0A0C2DRP1_9BILA|nr:ATP:cob(I)alamin adenosyltransferase [Ancylostoma duodenale]
MALRCLSLLHPARVVPLVRHLSVTPVMGRGFKQGRGTGDSGKSSLFNNERRWKDDDTFMAIGNTDELSSLLGVCRELAVQDNIPDLVEVLTRLQCCLQDIGAHLATPPQTSEKKKCEYFYRRKKRKCWENDYEILAMTFVDTAMVEWIHAEIDRFGDQLPPIRQFILSGGGALSAHLQFARAVCRRAERSVVPLVRAEEADPQAMKFLNRMSDLLFVLGRYACMKNGNEELTYLRPDTFVNQKWERKKL